VLKQVMLPCEKRPRRGTAIRKGKGRPRRMVAANASAPSDWGQRSDQRRCTGMSTKQAFADFLLRNGNRSFCARCVARAVKARTVPPVARAMKDLGATPGHRVEEGDRSNCERTTLTIRALWTGL
jgi:hypothetical protein